MARSFVTNTRVASSSCLSVNPRHFLLWEKTEHFPADRLCRKQSRKQHADSSLVARKATSDDASAMAMLTIPASSVTLILAKPIWYDLIYQRFHGARMVADVARPPRWAKEICCRHAWLV